MSYFFNGTAGGGGTGTVTATGGNLTANAVVLGAGGVDTKVSTGITSNGASEVDLGIAGGATGVLGLNGSTSGKATLTAPAVAGTIANPVALSNSLTVGGPQVTISAAAAGNGVLALAGNTSGTATLTAPAVAGTSTNGITVSNVLLAPFGAVTTPAYAFSGSATTGMWGGAGSIIFTGAGVNEFVITSSVLRGKPSSIIGWATGDPASTAFDTGLTRPAAGLIYAGNGAASNKTALIQSGMSQFVTANFTTSGVGTALEAITGLSITVPALAGNWTFHAHLAYSQAVGVGAVAFGIQAVTNAPTNIFATGLQQITVGPPATFTTGTLATLTTTTATNIVSGTAGATATNYICDLYGTCELGASANTIRILVSTSVAADLVTVLRGSYFTFNC